MSNVFWINDPNVLISNFSIWPMPHMNKNDKFNAISRLIVYMTLIGVFLTKSLNLLITGVITLAVIAFLYYAKDEKPTVQETFVSSTTPLYKSVPDNPMSNVQLPEIQFDPKRAKAPLAAPRKQEQIINENTKQMVINTSFKDDPELGEKLFKDLGDEITFDRSMRNFYTTANTTIPNDQKGFAEFCYGDMRHVKMVLPWPVKKAHLNIFLVKKIYLSYIMASVSNYVFNNMGRIGNDNCDTTERNLQNNHQSAWSLTNYFANDCNMKRGIDFALTSPAINFTGSHQVGIGGCNIDINSGLKIDPISRPPCRISLFQRPFATVPYLGRGAVDPMVESAIMQGNQISNRKTAMSYSEKSYLKHQYTPMIPSLANSITNPANLVEGVAVDGWIRGGIPSRELIRDEDTFKKHLSKQPSI